MTHLHAKDGTFKPVNIDILFYIKFANFWYITCFVTILIPIWPWPHGLIRKRQHFKNIPKTTFVRTLGLLCSKEAKILLKNLVLLLCAIYGAYDE